MVNAQKEHLNYLNEESTDFSYELEVLDKTLEDWSIISNELLSVLFKRNDYLKDGRSTRSLMALGALEAHLNMAMQALKASKEN